MSLLGNSYSKKFLISIYKPISPKDLSLKFFQSGNPAGVMGYLTKLKFESIFITKETFVFIYKIYVPTS